jgi:hypothetical protein
MQYPLSISIHVGIYLADVQLIVSSGYLLVIDKPGVRWIRFSILTSPGPSVTRIHEIAVSFDLVEAMAIDVHARMAELPHGKYSTGINPSKTDRMMKQENIC